MDTISNVVSRGKIGSKSSKYDHDPLNYVVVFGIYYFCKFRLAKARVRNVLIGPELLIVIPIAG